jgi:hypothetical protein
MTARLAFPPCAPAFARARAPTSAPATPMGSPTDGSRRSVSIRIERLSFAGLPLSRAEARQVGAALEAELGRLVAAASWAGVTGHAAPRPPEASLTVASGGSPEQLGRDLGHALFAALRQVR